MTTETGEKFKAELVQLLKKYDAELEAEDHWPGYAECGQDVRITVLFSDWQAEDLDLGKEVTGES